MSPNVIEVRPLKGYKIAITFDNGEAGVFDCSSYLSYPAFEELKNPAFFQQVKVGQGSICWPHGQDFCPDTLYLDSKKDEVGEINR